MRHRHDVVIVGGGPVGVGLAVELGLRGVSCLVLERRTSLSRIPKGQGLSQRSLEHCWFWGVDEQIRARRAMPPGYPIGQVTVYGSLAGEFWHAQPGRELVAPYYFRPNERLPQYRTEEVLRSRAAELPGVDLLLGATVTRVQQTDDGVSVEVTGAEGPQVVTADYVVGCDGGHSLVREQADIERTSTDFGQVMALVVFRSRELHEWLRRFPERSTYRVLHPDLEGYWMFFGRVDVGEEFFFHAPVPAGATQETFDFPALLHRAAGFPFDLEVEHVGIWDLRVQVATRYRAGRAFIAGDAAHTHPPYGGFGLNNGLEDAVNLGWKLAAVVHGWGGDLLLDSYGLEREPVFREVGQEIIGGWIESDRRFLQDYRPEDDRDAFEQAFEAASRGFGERLRHFEPHYEGSPVVVGPPGGVTSAHGVHTFAGRPGHHLPPRTLSTGRNVYEELGPWFTLLALDADEVDVRSFVDAAAELGLPLEVVRDVRAGEVADYGAALLLIRPDQFLCWVGETAPQDVDTVLRTAIGRPHAG